MIYLVDTNVLLRFAEHRHPQHEVVRGAVRKLRADGHELRATAQNFAVWNALTRPEKSNGFGLKTEEADHLLRIVERLFPLLPEAANAYLEWRRLIVIHGVSGVQVHDARLVAAMKAHGVTHILTLNTSDFTRYAPGVVAVNPASVSPQL